VGSRPSKKKVVTTSWHLARGRCVVMQSSTWRIWWKKQSTTVGAWDHEEECGVIGSRGHQRPGGGAVPFNGDVRNPRGSCHLVIGEGATIGQCCATITFPGSSSWWSIDRRRVWNPSGTRILAWWNPSRRIPRGGLVSHRSSAIHR
jgi:hypothetical protein